MKDVNANMRREKKIMNWFVNIDLSYKECGEK